MPKKKLRKILPTHNKIKEQKLLKFLGGWMNKQEIWSLKRTRIVKGVIIGIFAACLPMPFQMVLAAILAIIFHANLPVSVALVWISNPFTMPPIFYFEYQIGKLITKPENPVEFNFESMYDNFGDIAQTLWSGAIVVGIFSSVICAIIINFLWIYTVRKNRRKSQN